MRLIRKQGGAFTAASGMPSVQFSLINILDLYDKGILALEKIPELMSHNPAKIFNIEKRGFIKKGFFADFVIVKKSKEYILNKDEVISKCGWTPYEGRKYSWRIESTYSNGECVFSRKTGLSDNVHGREIIFDR